jgi:hypothetical protein
MQHQKIHTATSKNCDATSKKCTAISKLFSTTLKNMYYNITKINPET